MLRPLFSVLAAPLLVIAVAGCGGGDDSADDVKAEVAAQLGESGLTDEQATCFAGVIVDEVGVDKVKDVDFSSNEAPAGLEEEFTAAAIKALSECDIDLSSLNG